MTTIPKGAGYGVGAAYGAGYYGTGAVATGASYGLGAAYDAGYYGAGAAGYGFSAGTSYGIATGAGFGSYMGPGQYVGSQVVGQTMQIAGYETMTRPKVEMETFQVPKYVAVKQIQEQYVETVPVPVQTTETVMQAVPRQTMVPQVTQETVMQPRQVMVQQVVTVPQMTMQPVTIPKTVMVPQMTMEQVAVQVPRTQMTYQQRTVQIPRTVTEPVAGYAAPAGAIYEAATQAYGVDFGTAALYGGAGFGSATYGAGIDLSAYGNLYNTAGASAYGGTVVNVAAKKK